MRLEFALAKVRLGIAEKSKCLEPKSPKTSVDLAPRFCSAAALVDVNAVNRAGVFPRTRTGDQIVIVTRGKDEAYSRETGPMATMVPRKDVATGSGVDDSR